MNASFVYSINTSKPGTSKAPSGPSTKIGSVSSAIISGRNLSKTSCLKMKTFRNRSLPEWSPKLKNQIKWMLRSTQITPVTMRRIILKCLALFSLSTIPGQISINAKGEAVWMNQGTTIDAEKTLSVTWTSFRAIPSHILIKLSPHKSHFSIKLQNLQPQILHFQNSSRSKSPSLKNILHPHLISLLGSNKLLNPKLQMKRQNRKTKSKISQIKHEKHPLIQGM